MLALKLLKDESGFLIAGELVLVATILTLGMVVGLTSVQHAVNNELIDVADAYFAANQDHRYDSLNSGKVWGSGRNQTSRGNTIDIAGSGY